MASIQEAFDVWLGKGRPPLRARPPRSRGAIDLTPRRAGSARSPPRIVGARGRGAGRFVGSSPARGSDGLECEYGACPEERAPFHELARRHGLAPTGGSDYHGENKPGLSVGSGRGDLAFLTST